LLTLNPEERLGANGAREVKKHPFFEEINWDTILTQEPPFVPRVELDSTVYFEPREIRYPIGTRENEEMHIKELEEAAEGSTFVGTSEDLMFPDFWYVNFANLERKNLDLLENLSKFTKKRTKSC